MVLRDVQTLIMLGFGVKNSCSEIIPSQYVEVYKYDALIKLNTNVEDTKKIENKIEASRRYS